MWANAQPQPSRKNYARAAPLVGVHRIGIGMPHKGERSAMLSMQPIGYVRSPYGDTRDIPKGLGAKHEVEGVLEIRAELEPGLADIEGFSHLYVIWAFDRSEGCELVAMPPSDDRPHGVFATRSPRRPNPIGLTVVELLSREGPALRVRRDRHAGGNPDSRHQAVSLKRSTGTAAPRVAGGSRGARRRDKVALALLVARCIAL
jgi:tRNA-Thr(GGU) m(6)t(6)A37 methyltransferase TsaA